MRRKSRNLQKSRHPSSIEPLELRQMMSVAPQIDFSTFASLTNLVANGYASQSKQVNNSLALTSSVGSGQTRSVWFGTKVGVEQFDTEFTVKGTSILSPDGFTFTIQNQGTNALGSGPSGLGYQGISNSFAINFNLSNGLAGGTSTYGFSSEGAAPITTHSLAGLLDLDINNPIDVKLDYTNGNLSMTMTNENNGTQVVSVSTPVDIPALVNSDSAFVGFTAASNASVSQQLVSSWNYKGYGTPTFAQLPQPGAIGGGGRTLALSALGADSNSESNLTYTWTAVNLPSGAKMPVFSDNDTNTAKAISAKFSKAGTYVFGLTEKNAGGVIADTELPVVVVPIATSLRIAQHNVKIRRGGTEQFTATVVDQFNHSIAADKAVFSITSGQGSIKASSGLFIAPITPGHDIIEAKYLNLLDGTVGVTVTK